MGPEASKSRIETEYTVSNKCKSGMIGIHSNNGRAMKQLKFEIDIFKFELESLHRFDFLLSYMNAA